MGIETAIIGSAIAGAGASVFGASKASKAAKTSAEATKVAADQSTQEAARQYDQTRQDYAPWREVGQGALQQIAAQYGIPVTRSGPASSGQAPGGVTRDAVISDLGFGGYRTDTAAPGNQPSSAAPQLGAPDWRAYIAAHPDLAQAIQSNSFNGDTPEAQAADHYARYGKDAGWELPTTSAPAASTAPPAPAQPNGMATQVEGAGPALTARNSYDRGVQATAPAAYQSTNFTAPEYSRPEYGAPLDVSLGAFEASPESAVADNAFKTLADGSNAAFSATGGLQSGAAMKALADRAQGNKLNYYSQFAGRTTNQYNNDRGRFDANYNFDTGLDSGNKLAYTQIGQQDRQYGAGLERSDYQYGQNRADNIFSEDRAYGTDLYNQDRGYLTGRYDKKSGDLFSLASLGSGATGATASAGQDYTNVLSNNLFSTAAAQGKASQQVAGNTNQAVGNILGIGSSLANYYASSPSAYKNIPLNTSTVGYTAPTAVTAYRPSNILM